jgi:hypothetical protein
MANTPPSANPADDDTLLGAIKTAVRKEIQNTDGMLPVEVVAYDRATNRATVRHLVQMMATDGTAYDRADIASVRVYQFGNGTFSMSLPIKPGDRGWIMAADRDISLFQQDLKKGAPNTRRMKSFSDGLFMPDAMSMGDVEAPDGDSVTIQMNAGGVVLAMGENGFSVRVGGVSMEITGAGIAITGGAISHDGRNIGSTHVHNGITPGGANTGLPQP